MIVLDTTVLAYAVGTDHHLRAPSRQLVELVREGRVSATTIVEVIQEFAHIRARRRGREDAASLADDFAELLSPLLVVEERDLRSGLTLFQHHTHVGSFDAVLCAAARSIAADALVSADRAFSDVPQLNHVVPDKAGVDWLLEQDFAD